MDKKVLFLSTTFNSYYREIIKSFNDNNYKVDWYSDRPSNSIFTRALIRLNPKLLKRKIRRYEKRILDETYKKKYELVFVILGQSFTQDFWIKLKDLHRESKFIYYLWDSCSNFKCIENNYKYFDKVYSFDKRDCAKFNFNFLPLFFIEQFNLVEPNKRCYFDYAYIGTVKPGRFGEIKGILSQLDKNNFNGFKFFYLHSKNVLTYYKFKYKFEFKKVKKNDLNFKLLSKKECFDYENNSRIIVDVPQPGQFGLTIRIFEAIGMQKKIITTNSDIKNYDFYNKNNIYIVENGKIDFDDVFFHTEYEPLDYKIRQKYYISNWLKKILGE